MDPMTMMMGASAISGVAGSLLNTSSQQAINAQQLQFAQQQASGAFLPSFVGNAAKAGINPLAALGYHAAGSFSPSPTEPGAGLKGVGALAGANIELDHRAKMQAEEIAQARAFTNRAKAEVALNQHVVAALDNDPSLIPPGLSQRSPMGEATDWLHRMGVTPEGPFAHFWDKPTLQVPDYGLFGTPAP